MDEEHAETRAVNKALVYSRSARRDVRWWGLLIIGLVFAYGGYTIDPRSNCSESGECAPWLVPIALVAGLIAVMGGLSHLVVNPRRGSYVDIDAGELVWWEGKVRDGRSQGEGRLPLSTIARVRIVSGGDSDDDVFLYDHSGQLLPFAGSEVIRWPYMSWAHALAGLCPSIRIDEE